MFSTAHFDVLLLFCGNNTAAAATADDDDATASSIIKDFVALDLRNDVSIQISILIPMEDMSNEFPNKLVLRILVFFFAPRTQHTPKAKRSALECRRASSFFRNDELNFDLYNERRMLTHFD